MKSSDPIIEIIKQQCSITANDPVRLLCEKLLDIYGDAVQAILYYGSCLRKQNTLDGLVDLYVIVDSYRNTYSKRGLAVFNKLLPPNVYYMEFPYDGHTLRTKYAIVSLQDFQLGTSIRWFHSYLWGRFSQPSGLLYVHNEHVSEQITFALAQAVNTFISQTIPMLPIKFDALQLWQTGLSLSYQAELRAEKSNRVPELVNSFASYYETLTQAAILSSFDDIDIDNSIDPIKYHARLPSYSRWLCQIKWRSRQALGKILSILRLIKAAFTFHGGVDYIIWKLERHSGVTIEVTPKLRRYPLIYCWGTMWRLYRRGVFR